MLVIDGCDNLGKTTFAKTVERLARREGIPARYRHMGRPGPGWNFSFQEYQELMHPFAVQDRFHFGARIWHDNVMDTDTLLLITHKIRSMGGMLVLFRPADVDWYEQRLRSSNRDEMFDPVFLLEAAKRYESLWNLASMGSDYSIEVGGALGFPPDTLAEEIVLQWKHNLLKTGRLNR